MTAFINSKIDIISNCESERLVINATQRSKTGCKYPKYGIIRNICKSAKRYEIECSLCRIGQHQPHPQSSQKGRPTKSQQSVDPDHQSMSKNFSGEAPKSKKLIEYKMKKKKNTVKCIFWRTVSASTVDPISTKDLTKARREGRFSLIKKLNL